MTAVDGERETDLSRASSDGTRFIDQTVFKRFDGVLDRLVGHGLAADDDSLRESGESRSTKDDRL